MTGITSSPWSCHIFAQNLVLLSKFSEIYTQFTRLFQTCSVYLNPLWGNYNVCLNVFSCVFIVICGKVSWSKFLIIKLIWSRLILTGPKDLLVLIYMSQQANKQHSQQANRFTKLFISGVSRGGALGAEAPRTGGPRKKKEEEKKKKEKERKKEKEKEKERKEANDNKKYLSPSLPPLNGFKVSRNGPIRRTR